MVLPTRVLISSSLCTRLSLSLLPLPPHSAAQIDVEGAELSLLRGAQGLIGRWKPHVLIEEHAVNLRAFGATIEDVEAQLVSLGYKRKASTPAADALGSRDSLYEHPLFWSVEGRLASGSDSAGVAKAAEAAANGGGLADGYIDPNSNVVWIDSGGEEEEG